MTSADPVHDRTAPRLEVVIAEEANRPVLRRLLELYQHDFSEFDQSDVTIHGEYGYPYLDNYWTETNRHPFLLRAEERWAGFALVRTVEAHDMAEFFVLRKYRRQGLGRDAAQTIFRRLPGPWTVRQQLTNPAATAFWRRAIPHSFTESDDGIEVTQRFEAIV